MNTLLRSGAYPDLRLLTYFDVNKEEPWSPTSSPAAQAAFTSWVHQPYLKGRGRDLAAIAVR